MLFSGRLDGQDFAAIAARRNALLVLAVASFPYLPIAALAPFCRTNNSVCGILVYGLFFLGFPIAIVALSLSSIRGSARRLTDAGLPSLMAIALPLVLLMDAPWLHFLSLGSWTQHFGIGALGIGVPVSLLFALALMATLSVLRSAPAELRPDDVSARTSPTIVICALITIALLPAAATIIGAVIRGSPFALIETGQFRGERSSLLPLAIMLMMQFATLGLVAIGYREWRNQGSFGFGTGWMLAIIICIAVVLLGIVTIAVRIVAMGLAQIWGLKQTALLPIPLMASVQWIVLAELIALLILPWLLSNLPRGPAPALVAPTGHQPRPPRPEPMSGRALPSAAAGAVTFGRRGVR